MAAVSAIVGGVEAGALVVPPPASRPLFIRPPETACPLFRSRLFRRSF